MTAPAWSAHRPDPAWTCEPAAPDVVAFRRGLGGDDPTALAGLPALTGPGCQERHAHLRVQAGSTVVLISAEGADANPAPGAHRTLPGGHRAHRPQEQAKTHLPRTRCPMPSDLIPCQWI